MDFPKNDFSNFTMSWGNPIPYCRGKFIPVDTDINRIHGLYYMNGVLLTEDYHQDFDNLIEKEERTGWEYITPIRQKTMFRNEKEDL